MHSLYQYFKFRDINKNTIESLLKGTIYFSTPEKLNDPFDCNLDIGKSINNASTAFTKQELSKVCDLNLLKNFYEETRKIGICSFSLELKNTLLWSLYSNDHKGLAILYEFPEKFLNDRDKFIGISKVFYEENRLTNWFKGIVNQLPMDNKKFFIKLAKIYFTSKSPAWSYEKEARIISRYPGPLKIEKRFIKQICFGLNTSIEDIELIKEITSHYKQKVQFCKIVRSGDDFGIDVKEI